MRDCLILSYWFPPSGGAGTQRVAKACKYLPSKGWRPLVLAGEVGPDDHAPFLDESLEADVKGVKIVRVSAGRRGQGLHPLRSLRFRLGMDEWVDRAIPAADELVQMTRIEAVLTSVSPFSGWRLGRALQHKHGIPWILDLRDPWALDGWRSWRTPVHARWDLGQMRKALSLADAVIANTPEAAKEYSRLGVSPDRLCVIPNGFDHADFPDLNPTLERSTGTFVLVHVGTLHSAAASPGLTRNGVRWRWRQVAPLGRSGHYLLRALALLKARDPDVVRGVEVRLLGVVHPTHRAMASRLGVEHLIRYEGYNCHETAVRALTKADAIFVPLHGVPEGQRALVVPAKLYEALASGVPVLGALPPGDAADLVRRVAGGLVLPPCDEEKLAGALKQMVLGARDGNPTPGCDPGCIEPFERARLADLLAETLSRTAQGESLASLPSPWQQIPSLQ